MRLMLIWGAPGGAEASLAMARSLMVSSSDHGLKLMAPIVTGRPSFSDAIFSAWNLSSGGTASQASAQISSSVATSQAARNSQMRQIEERWVAEDFVEGIETVDSAALAAGSFMGISGKFSLINAKGQCLKCKLCDEVCAAKNKNPGQTSWSGLTADVYVHAVGGSQRRELPSHSAVKASDCFQIYQGWLPDERLNEQTKQPYADNPEATRQCFQSQQGL